MKILILSDRENPSLWEYFQKEKLREADLILSCGDLKKEYLEFLVTMANCPLLYVNGNHDARHAEYPPEGCDSLEDKVVTVKGLKIAGLGGSMRYKEGPFQYQPKEMEKRVSKLKKKIAEEGGLDILVTHAPVAGYGDRQDRAHQGFEAFDTLLRTCRVRYLIYGHVHKEYGAFERVKVHPSGTLLINGYLSCFLDTETGKIDE